MKPVITLYVEAACPICMRARRTLVECSELNSIAEVRVVDLRVQPQVVPNTFVGVPTTVFDGRIVALGTPDCSELVSVVRASIRERTGE